MNQIEKAKALIQTFANGNAQQALELLDPGYIQHNLNYPTGSKAFAASVAALGEAPVKTTVENIRAFEDGDKVFLHTVYDFAGQGKQVAFDIFRVNKDGKIAEHWDNLAALNGKNPSGHTQIDGPVQADDFDQTEANRQLVKDFIFDVLQSNHPEKIADYFENGAYIQHNTEIADGLSGLGEALAAMAAKGIEMVYNQVHQVLADGNFVLAASEGTFGGKPTSYYDLFRVENGKIREHWDVMETILPESEWKNENGKF